MIREMQKQDIAACVQVIQKAFMTVADEFGFTAANAPRFTAFATDEARLLYHYETEQRPMYIYETDGQIAGYYSLALLEDRKCELNNLAVLPTYRHHGIGRALLLHAFEEACRLNCDMMQIGIVEENQVIRKWYETYGFVHTGTKKFDFFPFTCGYMERKLRK